MRLSFLLRHCPPAIADSLYWRIFYKRQAMPLYAEYFERAPLAAAPGVAMSLSNKDSMHGMIAFTGWYERELTARIRSRAVRGGVLVDVGANWGYFSLIWAAANTTNRVIAIEAAPANIEPLRKNIVTNNFTERVTIVAAAAGATNEFLPFDTRSDDQQTGCGGLAPNDRTIALQVKVLPLDEICTGISRVDVLKVDVEGAESLVLRGARKLLKAGAIREIFLELNETRMKNIGIAKNEPLRILQEFGYICEQRGDALHARVA